MMLEAQLIVTPKTIGEATSNMYEGVTMTGVEMTGVDMGTSIDGKRTEGYWSSGWGQSVSAINQQYLL